MKAFIAYALFLAVVGSAVADDPHGWPEDAVRAESIPLYTDADYDYIEPDVTVTYGDPHGKRFVPAVAKQVQDWRGQCTARKPAIADAINKFCKMAGKSNHVPRAWTLAGIHSDDKKYDPGAHVSIAGGCFPQQWVPQKYCYLQFYKMCVHNPGTGAGAKSFGKGGCQTWNIERYGIPGAFSKVASVVLNSLLV